MSNVQTANPQLLCQYYLKLIYDEIQSKIHLKMPQDYGEILFEGVSKLISRIYLNEDDIFVDFGSGRGKIVSQIFLQTPVKEAYGIELENEFYQLASLIADRIYQDLPQFFSHSRKLAFYHGNFLNYPINEVTVALINSTSFTQKMLNCLGTLLNEVNKLHTIITMRPISTLTNFSFKRCIRIECSWDSALCYLYKKNQTPSLS